jgi:hypothetical protein
MTDLQGRNVSTGEVETEGRMKFRLSRSDVEETKRAKAIVKTMVEVKFEHNGEIEEMTHSMLERYTEA